MWNIFESLDLFLHIKILIEELKKFQDRRKLMVFVGLKLEPKHISVMIQTKHSTYYLRCYI